MTTVAGETEVLPAGPAGPRPEEVATDTPAGWRGRAAALAIDVIPGTAVLAAVAILGLAVPLFSRWWWVCMSVGAAAFALTAANRILLPALTGWSLGRAVLGIAVRRRDANPVGPGPLLLRELAHLLDTGSVGVGWLWPLWDRRRRTFADLLLGTEVHPVQPRPAPRRAAHRAELVFLAAALVCVAAGAGGYLAVYRADRGADAARGEAMVRGPKIIEELLSYDPASLPEDFARAQQLATDRYRPQLIAQQQVVREGKPVPNSYQVANAAVLSAEPDRAAMLLFLQGQRGERDRERFISATVRVALVRIAGQWRVDDLTVVTKPTGGDGGK